MLSLEKQVVSLELARRLRELGYPQESYFVWVETSDEWVVRMRHYNEPNPTAIPAPTVAELGAAIKLYDKWVGYFVVKIQDIDVFKADDLAEALIYFLENKLLNFGEKSEKK